MRKKNQQQYRAYCACGRWSVYNYTPYTLGVVKFWMEKKYRETNEKSVENVFDPSRANSPIEKTSGPKWNE